MKRVASLRLPGLLFIALLPLQLCSQTVKDYEKMKKGIEKCPQNVIHMPAPVSHPDAPKTVLPVSHIVVRDMREDTGYIGVQMAMYGKCWKVLFDKPLSECFAGYMNQSPDYPLSASPYSLVCFIRQFRVTQRDSSNSNTKRAAYSRVVLTAEALLVHGSDYFPAFKMDTTTLVLIDELKSYNTIPDMLTALLQQCAAINTEKTEAKHAYTLAALENHYREAAGKPILNADPPQAGIYMSFAEFVNNKPSITRYELKMDKLSATLYSVLPGGETVLQTKAFGYCDGSLIWLNISNIYYPLIRRQNTFEYIGDYHALNKNGTGYVTTSYLNSSSPNTLASSAMTAGLTSLATAYLGTITTLRGKVIHQLNLETGEVY